MPIGTSPLMTLPFPELEMAIVDDREFANVNGIDHRRCITLNYNAVHVV
jgi:hypothetical protein